MKNEYFDLSDYLEENEITFLKQKHKILLLNKEKIKHFLQSNASLKEQIMQLKKDLEIDISVFTYRNFLLKYFKKSYNFHNINKVFLNSKHTILELILNENFTDSEKIYNYLLDNGSLKKVKNDDTSSISYNEFCEKLEDYINIKNLDIKVIRKSENSIDEIDIKKEIQDTEIAEIIDNNKRIDIELIDGSYETHNLSFLKNYYLVEEFSGRKFDFVEKNLFMIPATNEGKIYNFTNIKKLLKHSRLIPEYSLVLHDNSNIDSKIYIYRYINGELMFLDSFSSLLIVDILELINNSIKSFLNIYNIYFQKENEYVSYEK
ncbi:hypothetical protein CPU12_01810 [Malaciobacter molluscorum LMG 25693]|uniref:Uncharacterized protein n=1 Tax=Malaciobacter molluscorum LMG 25693 TaxID=870501 RepID=A0A2G1DL09_9BACT|nr:hypothetical protein [Malaciobacter molluscorum]AXX92582.1 hypothetical protein AMOL_1615 [Malaciobacter molluscorum LMG 25693]PHO19006.1 hypothetical protein CPU12_01810 [Malaciobacter molluscorum LMG 25693]RXJ97313.1 hypothetical protein CRV00_00300 [Malaciobacter molluscorum]